MSSNFSLTTFNSKGRLEQIEYAMKAVANGETAIGIKCRNGVVLAVEKKMASPLIDESSLHKIQLIADHIGCTYAGLSGDFRVLLQKARKHTMKYDLAFNEPILLSNLCRNTAQTVQEYTQSGGVRPFGISVLVAGVNDGAPKLYQVDPSGAYLEWKASAVGKNAENAKVFLEKRYSETMELEDAIHTALLTMKDGFEGSPSLTRPDERVQHRGRHRGHRQPLLPTPHRLPDQRLPGHHRVGRPDPLTN